MQNIVHSSPISSHLSTQSNTARLEPYTATPNAFHNAIPKREMFGLHILAMIATENAATRSSPIYIYDTPSCFTKDSASNGKLQSVMPSSKVARQLEFSTPTEQRPETGKENMDGIALEDGTVICGSTQTANGKPCRRQSQQRHCPWHGNDRTSRQLLRKFGGIDMSNEELAVALHGDRAFDIPVRPCLPLTLV